MVRTVSGQRTKTLSLSFFPFYPSLFQKRRIISMYPLIYTMNLLLWHVYRHTIRPPSSYGGTRSSEPNLSALTLLQSRVRVAAVIGHQTSFYLVFYTTKKCLLSGFATLADRKQASLTLSLTRPTEFPKYWTFWWKRSVSALSGSLSAFSPPLWVPQAKL